MNKEKIAVVFSGGGTLCAYSAGVVSALVKKYDLKKPDIIIGNSGGAGTAAYYVSGQYDLIERIWGEVVATNKFVDYLRIKEIADIDFIIEIFSKIVKLNLKSIKNSKIKFFISTTNSVSGKVKYFSNKDNILEALRASMAMPVVYNKEIIIGKQKYIDSPITCLPVNIKKAISLGAKKIIVVGDDSVYPLRDSLFKVWILTKSKEFNKSYNDYLKLSKTYKIPKNIKVVYISSKNLPVGVLDINKTHLKNTINKGYNDTINNKDLEKLFL
ncbi:MAG: patatin-like phospholipase family protein [archaeon]